jgi:arsenate reductase-like glutaredoxin family protein
MALREPRLLRRPLLVDGSRVLVGGREVSEAS